MSGKLSRLDGEDADLPHGGKWSHAAFADQNDEMENA